MFDLLSFSLSLSLRKSHKHFTKVYIMYHDNCKNELFCISKKFMDKTRLGNSIVSFEMIFNCISSAYEIKFTKNWA